MPLVARKLAWGIEDQREAQLAMVTAALMLLLQDSVMQCVPQTQAKELL